MSLITTLIPAYKKEYLGEAFAGLARQTFQDFRVILSDDSPDAEITQLIRDGHFGEPLSRLNLLVVRGPQSGRRNHERLLDLWDGRSPLVHFHLDDDLIHPDFYARHVAVHAGRRCGLSVSRRHLSGADGRPSGDLPLPPVITEQRERVLQVPAATIFATTAAVCENWLGELNHMVFSAEAARLYPRPPKQGLSYYGLLDIGAVLEISRHLPVVYLQDHLGVFRQHVEQTTHQQGSHGIRIGFLAWTTYALAAWHEQRITSRQAAYAIATATRRIVQRFANDPVMEEYLSLLEAHAHDLGQLHATYAAFWNRLLASHHSTRAEPMPMQRPVAAAVA